MTAALDNSDKLLVDGIAVVFRLVSTGTVGLATADTVTTAPEYFATTVFATVVTTEAGSSGDVPFVDELYGDPAPVYAGRFDKSDIVDTLNPFNLRSVIDVPNRSAPEVAVVYLPSVSENNVDGVVILSWRGLATMLPVVLPGDSGTVARNTEDCVDTTGLCVDEFTALLSVSNVTAGVKRLF